MTRSFITIFAPGLKAGIDALIIILVYLSNQSWSPSRKRYTSAPLTDGSWEKLCARNSMHPRTLAGIVERVLDNTFDIRMTYFLPMPVRNGLVHHQHRAQEDDHWAPRGSLLWDVWPRSLEAWRAKSLHPRTLPLGGKAALTPVTMEGGAQGQISVVLADPFSKNPPRSFLALTTIRPYWPWLSRTTYSTRYITSIYDSVKRYRVVIIFWSYRFSRRGIVSCIWNIRGRW